MRGGLDPRRQAIDVRVTFWLKVVALVVLSWLVVERLIGYLAHVGYAVAVAVGGIFVAYMFYPIVRRLNERLPLWAAIGIVYLSFAGLMLLVGSYLVPILAADAQAFIASLPKLEANAQAFFNAPQMPLVPKLPPDLHRAVETLPTTIGSFVQQHTTVWIGNMLGMLVSALALAAIFVAIPVASIYMLVEAENIKRTFLGMLPESRRDRMKNVLSQLDDVFGGFVRGQMLIALTVGIMVTAMLALFRVPYALLIGVWAGIADIVPYLGAVAGAVPAVAIALLTNGVGDAALVVAGFTVINQLEGSVIAPRVVSRAVHVSPLAVIFGLLVGAELFGVIGMVVAVPIVGALRVLIDNVRPPDEMTNAQVEPGLTKAPQADVDPEATSTSETTTVESELEAESATS
jgi:predicted PurR-regulated permease PerM